MRRKYRGGVSRPLSGSRRQGTGEPKPSFRSNNGIWRFRMVSAKCAISSLAGAEIAGRGGRSGARNVPGSRGGRASKARFDASCRRRNAISFKLRTGHGALNRSQNRIIAYWAILTCLAVGSGVFSGERSKISSAPNPQFYLITTVTTFDDRPFTVTTMFAVPVPRNTFGRST